MGKFEKESRGFRRGFMCFISDKVNIVLKQHREKYVNVNLVAMGRNAGGLGGKEEVIPFVYTQGIRRWLFPSYQFLHDNIPVRGARAGVFCLIYA